MLLFEMVAGHKNWGWLSEEAAPWDILSRKTNSGLIGIVTDLVKKEVEASQKFPDVDVSRGPVFIHEGVKIGTNVRIEGPVYVEEGAEIRHGAYLRPGTYLCNDCVVGHSSEVKNTLMMPRSKAPHFNYVGDSIIGVNVNLGAGAKISNVRLDRRTVPIQIPNIPKIDSGLRKLGAMIGDSTEIGCNVVTNPGAVIPPLSAVPPNTVVTGYWDH